MKYLFVLTCLTLAVITSYAQKSKSASLVFRFDLGQGKVKEGFTKVTAQTLYTAQKGFGIDLGTEVNENPKKGKEALTDGFFTSSRPFYFSVKVPEGNYHVKVTLGDDDGVSDAVIRAECRRMMVNRIQTLKGQHKTVEFTLHIRDSIIKNGNQTSKIKLKQREYAYLHWDDKLTLEFNGEQPKVNAIEITPENPAAVTLFLAGNSTVVDGANEPYSAWGQMFPSFFQAGNVAVANFAESGETLKSFIGARRFAKLLSMMKPGDYAFVEFGHNDQKSKRPDALTEYKKNLEFFIDEVKKKGGIPVLVTSVQRRRFDETGKIVETLGEYPSTVRNTAKEKNVAMIDLNAMSKVMYEAWGPEESIKAFAHFPANTYPGQTQQTEDNTHFRPFGAYEVARLMIKGVRDKLPELARLIATDVPMIDPAKPDAYATFYWPDSPTSATVNPDGN